MFQVEVRVPDEAVLPERMEKMRTWLDGRRYEPATFRHVFGSGGILFRIDFAVEAEASEFAAAFGGTLTGGSAQAM